MNSKIKLGDVVTMRTADGNASLVVVEISKSRGVALQAKWQVGNMLNGYDSYPVPLFWRRLVAINGVPFTAQ